MALVWKKIMIQTDNGESVEAVAPIIISASRSTDIPAFHAKWFLNRLEKGYAIWVNPFNRATQYVSFSNARVVVFWTKNPEPIISGLSMLDKTGINYYFQYTLNDYEDEKFEPNVPNLDIRIETFKRLSDRIGKEKVIWRFDPLILSDKLSVNDLLNKVRNVGNRIISYTDKLVFSFADIMEYQKVQNNLVRDAEGFTRENIIDSEFTLENKVLFAKGIQRLHEEWKTQNPEFKIATCAEDIPLEKYGIDHNRCIDDELMVKLFPHDRILMEFLGYQPDYSLFGYEPQAKLKDKGQRMICGCILSKDIGSYNTCNHLCKYCYANTSAKMVKNNQSSLKENSESILPV